MIDKNKGYESEELALIEDLNSCVCPSGRQNILILDLQCQIMRIVSQHQQRQLSTIPLLASLTQDLQILMQTILQDVHIKSAEQTLQVRLHQLALAKILVFTHGKSDFRLVSAHFAIGKAYLQAKCFDQAVNHLTIASTKVSKMGDVKDTKVYNSYILTALARCYLALEGHHHALELLTRAYDIQSNNQNLKGSSLALQTLQLLANIHLKLNSPKQAIRVLDKLIDILNTQFVDFDSLHCRLREIADKQPSRDEKRVNNVYRKKADSIQLTKIVEHFKQKLEFLIVEYDRSPLKDRLEQVLKDLDSVWSNTSVLGQFLAHLQAITSKLVQQLKRQRIFKFKVYWQGEGEHLNNSIDRELKTFIKQYDEQPDHPLKKLTKDEKLQVQKLLVQYCVRFSDHETQLSCLKRLQNMLVECVAEGSPQYKFQLLKVKRNTAMILSQARMVDNLVNTLKQIRDLEKQLYGRNSLSVKKTCSMMLIVQQELKANNSKFSTEGETRDKRNSTKSKKPTLRFEQHSRRGSRVLRP